MTTEYRRLDGLNLPARLLPSVPKGVQIREILLDASARLGPGAKLPSERALAEHYSVARMTVRAEILRLVQEGVLEIRPASGTFVAKPHVRGRLGKSYSTSLAKHGISPGARVLDREVLVVTESMSALQAAVGSSALRLTRLRTGDDVPLGVETSLLSLDVFPGLDACDLEGVSLYEVLVGRWGVRLDNLSSTISVAFPSSTEADALQISRGVPCLVIDSVLKDGSGAVLEVARSLYRGDVYTLDAEFLLDSDQA